MKILFVEDDDDKAQKVMGELRNIDSDLEFVRAKSFTSALQCLVKRNDIEGVILDMSMPNYENSQEPPESFAGRDLLEHCKLRKIEKPTFVVTMLDLFGSGSEQITLEQLSEELAAEFSPMYLGIVYYSSAQESWKSQLSHLIGKMKAFSK